MNIEQAEVMCINRFRYGFYCCLMRKCMRYTQAYNHAYLVCNMFVLNERLCVTPMYYCIMIMIYDMVFIVWNFTVIVWHKTLGGSDTMICVGLQKPSSFIVWPFFKLNCSNVLLQILGKAYWNNFSFCLL